MKPHIHCELIKAWADGAQIQHLVFEVGTTDKVWKDVLNNRPEWNAGSKYRIKPREFKLGERYPVITANTGQRYIAVYECINGEYSFALGSYNYKEEYFSWIGEKLEIDWPED